MLESVSSGMLHSFNLPLLQYKCGLLFFSFLSFLENVWTNIELHVVGRIHSEMFNHCFVLPFLHLLVFTLTWIACSAVSA